MRKGRIALLIFAFALALAVLCLSSCMLIDVPGSSDGETEYNVSSGCFELVDFELESATQLNVQTGKITDIYQIKITSKCEYPLTEYFLNVAIYSSKGILTRETINETKEISANKEFYSRIEISEEDYEAIKSISVMYSGKSPKKPSKILYTEHKKSLCAVNFYYNDTVVAYANVNAGETVEAFDAPKIENHIFLGWYANSSKTEEFDFSKPITEDTDVYASYMLDAAKITNLITTEKIKGLVTVYNRSYNTGASITSQGSGVIFSISGGYAYALTNCHVAKIQDGYKYQTITVEDYKGNEYQATVYKNPNKSASAIDSSYDLALICFKVGTDTDLLAIRIGEDPKVGADVIALGTPKGQQNAISFGKVQRYANISADANSEISDVTFKVIYHDAFIDNGSSGGPLLNHELALVGLNFARSEGFDIGGAIPLSKIKEFLNTYVY